MQAGPKLVEERFHRRAVAEDEARRCVVCLRHPIESARSLETRDALPLQRGLRLWLTYTASALINTAGEPRLLLFYEDALADPVAAAAALDTAVS